MRMPGNMSLVGIAVILPVIVVMPALTAPGYSIIRHSISELGAQVTPASWLMNLGFWAFGLGVTADAIRRYSDQPIGALAFTIFGLSMILCGLFSHRPIDETLPFSQQEDDLHSVFASLAGTSFVFGAISFAFTQRETWRRLACLAAAILATSLSVAMAQAPDMAGLPQRAIFAISFVWLPLFLAPGPGRA